MTDTADVKAMAERLRRLTRGNLARDWEAERLAMNEAADLLDRLSAPAQVSGTPFAYAYEYPTYDGPVIRFETNGREINGSKPTRAIPLYTHPSAGPAVREEGLPYGIIDPDYAAFFTVARLVAWSYGYGVGLHGSFTRDLDLILVPWTDRANPDPDHVLKNIESRSGWKRIKDDGSKHPHGRLVWTLTSRRFECPRFIDIGFMPLTTPDPQGPSEKKDDVQTRPQNEESRVAETANAEAGTEIRMNRDGVTVDEIVARNCYFHIEQMNQDGFWFCINDSHFWVGKNSKSHVDLLVTDHAETEAEESTGRQPPAVFSDASILKRCRARRIDTKANNKWEAHLDKRPVGRAPTENAAIKIAYEKAVADTRPSESAGFPPRAVFADPILHSDTKKG